MNVIDLIAPSLPALLKTIDGRKTVPRGFTLHTAGAQIVDVAPGLLHALPLDADRPEHRRAALPRGDRRARLRALPPRRRHPRRVRRDLHGVRALRLLGPAALVGRPDPRAARRDAARRRRARHVARRADALGTGRDRGRPDHALPQGPCAVPHVDPAGGDRDGTARRFLGVRDGEGGRRSAGARSAVGPQEIVGMEGVARDGGYVFVRGELWRARSATRTLAPGRARPGRRRSTA